MLSREKGQRVATRPVADADAEEPDEESRADGPPASADSEVPRRIPVKTNARTINELRLRLGGRWNEERMRVARVCGIGVTVGGCLVTSGCVYSGDCGRIKPTIVTIFDGDSAMSDGDPLSGTGLADAH